MTTALEIPIFPEGEPGGPPQEALEGWAAVVEAINRLADKMPNPSRQRSDLSQHIWYVDMDPVPLPLVGGVGFLDVPQQFSPSIGYNFDVHRIQATGFTAGNVTAWVNANQAAAALGAVALKAVFSAQGLVTNGKAQCLIKGQDRIGFYATGITGSVYVSFSATCVSDTYLSEYLK